LYGSSFTGVDIPEDHQIIIKCQQDDIDSLKSKDQGIFG